MLDDVKKISKIDKSKMLDALEKFPDQIQNTIDIIENTDLKKIFKVDNIIFSGMGGSAISGDILQALLRNKLDIPVFVNRGYDLPKWANKNTLVFSQSYSGNTEETLSTFKHAYQKRCKIIAISSNGKLQEFCKKRELPYISIPSGFAPRAATAYLLFSALLSLSKIGLLHYSFDLDIKETLKITTEFNKKNNKETPVSDNPSKRLAADIHQTIPQVYGWEIYSPIARRWCTQFNENSKIICRYDEVSECNHNDIVGWSMNPEATKNFSCMLFRDKDEESIYMSKRLDFMNKLYNDIAKKTIEINVEGKKRLAKMMYAMYLGDYTSCYLAILRKVDPTPVEAINELKKELAKI